MGILNWLKLRKKETPAQVARRRMSQANTEEVGHPEQAVAAPVVQELPTLDPSVIAEAHTWAQPVEEQRSPEAVRQKILDKMSQQPQRREWKKVDSFQEIEAQPVAVERVNDQVVMEQISFDQVGVDSELAHNKKH